MTTLLLLDDEIVAITGATRAHTTPAFEALGASDRELVESLCRALLACPRAGSTATVRVERHCDPDEKP